MRLTLFLFLSVFQIFANAQTNAINQIRDIVNDAPNNFKKFQYGSSRSSDFISYKSAITIDGTFNNDFAGDSLGITYTAELTNIAIDKKEAHQILNEWKNMLEKEFGNFQKQKLNNVIFQVHLIGESWSYRKNDITITIDLFSSNGKYWLLNLHIQKGYIK